MSSGFYVECLEEIAQLIRQGRIPEARAKVDTELAMPYVPSDVLPALQDFDRQLRLLAAENRKPGVGVMSLEEIEEGLKGDREHQLQAVDALHGMNLRSCLDLIRAADRFADRPTDRRGADAEPGRALLHVYSPLPGRGGGKRRLSSGPYFDPRMAGKREPILI